MDYYIVVNGEKQGPFDILGLIKKVKTGVVQPETQILDANGNYVPASSFPELNGLFAEQSERPPVHYQQETTIKLRNVVYDAFELWVRRVVEYTLIFGAIMILGFVLSFGLRKIAVVAHNAFVADYIVGVFSISLLGLFYYYVLITKRSQEPEAKEIKAVATRSMPNLLFFSMIISLGAITYSLGPIAAVATMVVMFFLTSMLVFVPFLIVDHRMTLARAAAVSIGSFKSMSATNLATVLVLVGINVAVVILLGLISSTFIVLGLIISVPITVAGLAYVYDQILA